MHKDIARTILGGLIDFGRNVMFLGFCNRSGFIWGDLNPETPKYTYVVPNYNKLNTYA